MALVVNITQNYWVIALLLDNLYAQRIQYPCGTWGRIFTGMILDNETHKTDLNIVTYKNTKRIHGVLI